MNIHEFVYEKKIIDINYESSNCVVFLFNDGSTLYQYIDVENFEPVISWQMEKSKWKNS